MKQWNLGNTTVRNPERIKPALQVLADNFVGKNFVLQSQKEYFELLVSQGVVVGNPPKESSRAHSARKWASAFNQLGFALCKSGSKVIITPAGQALLDSENTDEVFLRQLWKLQLPSPFDRGTMGFSVHPLYLIIQCCLKLHEQGYEGITREEIALFIQTTTDDNLLDEVVNNIITYRNHRKDLTGRVVKRKFYLENLINKTKELYKDVIDSKAVLLRSVIKNVYDNNLDITKGGFADELNEITRTGKGSNVGSARTVREKIIKAIGNREEEDKIVKIVEEFVASLKSETIDTYSDTTVRYSRITGLFTISGEKLILKDDYVLLVTQLIKDNPVKLYSNKEFIPYYYSDVLPALPTDNSTFLEAEIGRLKGKAIEYGLQKETIDKFSDSGTLIKLKETKSILENEITKKKEIIFYRSQSSKEQIVEIKNTFESISNREIIGGSDYYPAWAEWGVWRVFLAINTIANPIHTTRNFQIDSELNPIHHAKAGVADMVFQYSDGFILPVEVTLNTNDRQYSAEREPVQTHVLRFCESEPDKKVLGVFVAPTIDLRTAVTFFDITEYDRVNKKVTKLNIVPLTIPQLMSLLPGEKNSCSNSTELISRLKNLLDLKNGCSSGIEWLNGINQSLSN